MPTPLRFATFNVENLFSRPRALLEERAADSRAILDDIARLNTLIQKPAYSAADQAAMVALLDKHQVETKPSQRPFFIAQVRKKLYKRPAGKPLQIVATGRGDWDGWIELERDEITSAAVENTARVLAAVDADVVCLVEVEDRITLQRFLDKVLHRAPFFAGKAPYPHNLLIDGNDDRGIDVALLSRHPIREARSHIDDLAGKSRIFSRDCPEYEVLLPGGRSLWVLPNHLKSKGFGSQTANNARRLLQAAQIAKILAARYDLTRDHVIVAGDLNDVPGSAPLAPLLGTAHLSDALDALPAGADRWTYRAPKHQIDYLLLSDPLRGGIQQAGIERRGIFHQTDFGGKYPSFPEVTSDKSAASDHACAWVDLLL